MRTSSIETTNEKSADTGDRGQILLAAGQSVAIRLWDKISPTDDTESVTRDYETVGYVIDGLAEVTIGGQTLELLPGNSWLVPKGTPHTYKIINTFTAIEATSPPARLNSTERGESDVR